jgi:hypothetical protein
VEIAFELEGVAEAYTGFSVAGAGDRAFAVRATAARAPTAADSGLAGRATLAFAGKPECEAFARAADTGFARTATIAFAVVLILEKR